MENSKSSWFEKYAWLFVVVVLVLLNIVMFVMNVSVNFEGILSFFSQFTPESIISFVKSFGVLAPVVIVILFIIESIFAPLPGQVVTMATGSLYGPIWGTALAAFGVIVGSIFPFYIARILGRPVVEKLVDINKLEKADKFFNHHKGIIIFMLIRILPIATFDVISYSAGLTKMSFWKYLIVTIIATIPKVVIYTNIGHFLASGSTTALVIFIALTAFGAFTMFFGFWIFKKIVNRRRAQRAEVEGED